MREFKKQSKTSTTPSTPIKINPASTSNKTDHLEPPMESSDQKLIGIAVVEEGRRYCVECRTTTTPMWRGGPTGPRSLCNACGIRYRKKRKELGLENKQQQQQQQHQQQDLSEATSAVQNSSSSSNNKSSSLQVVKKRRVLMGVEEAAFLLMALSSSSTPTLLHG